MRDPTNPDVLTSARNFVDSTNKFHINGYPINPDTIYSLAKEAVALHLRLTLAVNHINNLQDQIAQLRSEIASPTE